MTGGLVVGPDGRRRCWWCGTDPRYQAYHDDEWAHPLTGEAPLFERLSLEAFQAGLSWLTILRKREGFRAAFSAFDPVRVAAYDGAHVQRLLADPGIVRNRAKIEATVANARALLALHERGGSLSELVWASGHARRRAPRTPADIPSETPESRRLARRLNAEGFRFVGPTTCYATLQAVGVVNDHLADCDFRGPDG